LSASCYINEKGDYYDFLKIADGLRAGTIDLWRYKDIDKNQYMITNNANWICIGQIDYIPLMLKKDSNEVYIYNEFPFASTFIQNDKLNTVSLMTSMFKGQYSMDYSGIIAASLMIMLPELVFYVFLQKYIIGGMTAGAVKG